MAQETFYQRIRKRLAALKSGAKRKRSGGMNLHMPLLLLMIFGLATAVVLFARSAFTITSEQQRTSAEPVVSRSMPARQLLNTAQSPDPGTLQEPTITPLPQSVQQDPTPTASSQATPQSSPGSGLVGPEWTVVSRGDINQDGREDVVAFKWPAFPVDAPIWQQSKTSYPSYTTASTEIVIVQRGDDGSPQILLDTSATTVESGGTVLVNYPSGSVAGYLLRTSEGAAVPVSFMPINGDFSGFGQDVGVYWDASQQRFRLFGGGQL